MGFEQAFNNSDPSQHHEQTNHCRSERLGNSYFR
jgi:hypothetical protein